ncbi:MAG: F0F1 ATP synthase subunit A [Clostridiales bacterium]|nr:F0F1 ATP synthase subunit A [Clostridiales bacterium]MDY3747944.1 F0F1 ATP synthase subunit A [Lachnospiraceae bacterium]
MGQEVDFMIHGYLKLNFFGSDVYITTTHVCLCIICLTLIALGLVVSQKMKHAKAVPDGIQNVAEFYVEMLDGMVKGSMFRHWGKYANYILTIFMFILFSNISGIFGLRPPTADYCVTLTLALITFAVIQFNAFRTNGAFGYLKSLTQPIPLLFPINVIGEIATPVSLSLRLFGNIMGGTVMLALYYGLLPKLATLGIPVFLHVYLDIFSGAIQTYVFCMLSMVFINDKLPE